MKDESASATPPDGAVSAENPAGQSAASTSGADQPFYSGFEDEAVRTWAEGKGLKSAEQAVKSYMNAEKLIGAPAEQIVRLPKEGDTKGLEALYTKLGRPSEATAYELSLPEGVEETAEIKGFQDRMKQVFFEAGLSPDQVKIIEGGYNEFGAQNQEELLADYETSVQAQKLELEQEWGQGHDRMMRMAERATETLGLTTEIIDGIEGAIGYKETIKFVAGLGKRMMEDSFVSSDTRGTGFNSELTPAEARQAYDDFVGDPKNVAALMDKTNPGHAGAMRKKQEFFRLMHPSEG